MLGAVCGDIAGSIFEFHPLRGGHKDFPLFSERGFFTDDSVLSFAVAKSIMENDKDEAALAERLIDNFRDFVYRYPKAGYGGKFIQWALSKSRAPYNSFGNGSAMRVSPVGWAYNSLEDVEKYAEITSAVTHNHPEGIKGACAVAGSIFLARNNAGKDDIRSYVSSVYNYDLNRSVADIKENYTFNETCQGSVPEAIIAFLESENYEDAVRKAIWLGGDADTQAAISGSIAEAFYGMPENARAKTLGYLDKNLLEIYGNWQEYLKNGSSIA